MDRLFSLKSISHLLSAVHYVRFQPRALRHPHRLHTTRAALAVGGVAYQRGRALYHKFVSHAVAAACVVRRAYHYQLRVFQRRGVQFFLFFGAHLALLLGVRQRAYQPAAELHHQPRHL